jgi:hypothetical protein
MKGPTMKRIDCDRPQVRHVQVVGKDGQLTSEGRMHRERYLAILQAAWWLPVASAMNTDMEVTT